MDALAPTLAVLTTPPWRCSARPGAGGGAKHDIITSASSPPSPVSAAGAARLPIDAPVFWVARPAYVGVCLAAALGVWIFGWGQGREKTLLWLDAVGMAAYAVVGALKATSLGAPPFTAIVMGVLTSTFGGVIRDVLAHQPSILLRRELYVTPADRAAVFVGLNAFGPTMVAGFMGFIAAFTVRAAHPVRLADARVPAADRCRGRDAAGRRCWLDGPPRGSVGSWTEGSTGRRPRAVFATAQLFRHRRGGRSSAHRSSPTPGRRHAPTSGVPQVSRIRATPC